MCGLVSRVFLYLRANGQLMCVCAKRERYYLAPQGANNVMEHCGKRVCFMIITCAP